MSGSILFTKALLLSAPTQGVSPSDFAGVLLVLVAVSVGAWVGGLRLVRRKEHKVLVFIGAVVLVVALAISLLTLQLLLAALGDL